MILLISAIIVLLVGGVIILPFLGARNLYMELDEEGSIQADLGYRWEGLVTSLQDVEADRSFGTLSNDDYQWLKQRYMAEAVTLLKAAEIEQQEQSSWWESIEAELEQVRQRILGNQDEATENGSTANVASPDE